MRTRNINKIFVHCSASPDSNPNVDVDIIDSWHKARGFSEIGYHAVILKNGVIQEARAESKTPAAQKGHNTGSLAVCWVGLYKITTEQLRSLRSQIQEWCLKYKLDPFKDVYWHSDINHNKECPCLNKKETLEFINNSNLEAQDYVKKVRIK